MFDVQCSGVTKPGRRGSLTHWLTIVWICLTALGPIASRASAEDSPREQAQLRYQQAQKQLQEQPRKVDPAWQFGRACFDLGELATNSTERAQLAQQGIDACHAALGIDSHSAAAHYYLGLNLGQLARTKSLGALKLVTEMEREFTLAGNLDPQLDFAGPDRSLGLLYRDAPTIVSIGNRSKAKLHLRRAVELFPDYPENRLDLLESYLKWGDRNDARRELSALESIWPKAREKLKGPEWKESWTDWEGRLDEYKRKVEESAKLETPRH